MYLILCSYYSPVLYSKNQSSASAAVAGERMKEYIIGCFEVKNILGSCAMLEQRQLEAKNTTVSWTYLLACIKSVLYIFKRKLSYYQTQCSQGCSTNTFVTHSFIELVTDSFPLSLQNIITPKP